MTSGSIKSNFARVALVTLLAAILGLSLVGLSGMIIFADISTPQPLDLARGAMSSPSAPLSVSGGAR